MCGILLYSLVLLDSKFNCVLYLTVWYTAQKPPALFEASVTISIVSVFHFEKINSGGRLVLQYEPMRSLDDWPCLFLGSSS